MYLRVNRDEVKRMEILKTDCKLTLKQVVDQYKPDILINGGLYSMKTGRPNPIPLRINGKTVATSKDGYWVLAWNEGPDICMVHSTKMETYENVIACSTMLKDGKETAFNFTPAQGGVRARTAFGCDKNAIHFTVTREGNGHGLSPYMLRDAMESYNCEDAIMLDSGGSSQMYVKGKYNQSTGRKVSYWIAAWLRK